MPEYITALDALVSSAPNGYITKTALGTSSDNQTIYMYNLIPQCASLSSNKKIPKILITSGQHGFEKSAPFGIYYFIRDLIQNWYDSPILDYIRHHVEFKIIPMVNTYGVDQSIYKNANGVNLNRNYDNNWRLIDDPTSSEYGGQEPFDQPETQLVRDFFSANRDAVCLIDYHNFGANSATEQNKTMYNYLPMIIDEYEKRLADAAKFHHKLCTDDFKHDYLDVSDESALLGDISKSAGYGLLKSWANAQGMIATTLEITNGFYRQASFNEAIEKANAEFLGNFIITLLNYLA